MARTNKFNNKRVILTEKKDSNDTDTFDSLPKFEPDANGVATHEVIKGDGSKAKIILNCYSFQSAYKGGTIESKGKVFPIFFFPLFQYNKDIAIELARTLFSLMKTARYSSSTIRPYTITAQYIIDEKIYAINKLSLQDFNQIIDRKSSTRPRVDFNSVKKLFQSLPSINHNVKEELKELLFGYKNITSKDETFEERVASAKLNVDYSDYVMFQIYAYVNACLSEIEDTVAGTLNYLSSTDYFSFFEAKGKEKYLSLIIKGDDLSLNKAFLIELGDVYRANNAIGLLRMKLTDIDWVKFKENILSSNYQSLIAETWPQEVIKSIDVVFLCRNIIPTSLMNVKSYKQEFFRQIENNGVSIDLLYRSKNSLKKKNNINNKEYKHFQLYKLNNSFIFSSFHNLNKNGKKSSAPLHHILLGKTKHFDFLLILLLLAESGRNKEVILSIPTHISNLPILENDDLFSSEKSVELIGFKTRGHLGQGVIQPESIIIPHQSPIFRLLKLFSSIKTRQIKHRKFLFAQTDIFKQWRRSFSENNQLKEKNGDLIGPILSTKFRKVFAGEMLQKWLKKIRNKDDLIKAVANDLQNTIPLTYLLQSSTTESMIATAIVGLQMKFIEHHQIVSAKLKTNGQSPKQDRIQRFLCDCLDPYNPDYAEHLNIKYCKQFDNCLGCSKAEVYEEHLQNIIYRCFQYEELLKINRDLYDANYALKHNRAKQVIETFISKKSNGHKIHNSAFTDAFQAWEDPDNYLLPPILHSNA